MSGVFQAEGLWLCSWRLEKLLAGLWKACWCVNERDWVGRL